MELVAELLELMATLSTPDGWMAVAVGLAVGLTVGLLVAAGIAVVLGHGTRRAHDDGWYPAGWQIIERR